jgi:DNA-binding response OmpR family regulator
MIEELKADIQSRRKLARVLVVEDEPTAREAVRLFLEFRGHEVSVAATAEEALETAERFGPQVLVCDWQLKSGADGVQVAHSLQREHDVAVIMVTAHRLEALKDEVRRFAVDVSAYRRKPVSLASLAETIESLDHHGSRG